MNLFKNNGLRIKSLLFCAILCSFLPRAAPASEPETNASLSPSFEFQDGVLWGLVLSQAALYALDTWDLMPIGAPLMGPTFDPNKPDADYLLSDQLDTAIGNAYQDETVPTSAIVYATVGTLAGLNGLVALSPGGGHWRPYHQVSLGLTTAMFTTISVTEILKRSVGRLRPDFRERFLARGCQGALNVEASDLPCDEVNPKLKNISEEEYNYGRRSFPSGHSSTAFALGTFIALYLNHMGQDLHADNPTAAYASWGGAVVSLGLATAVAGSRVLDHRHHWEDVISGSLIGSAIAAASYFFITAPVFENQSSLTLGVQPIMDGPGALSISGKW